MSDLHSLRLPTERLVITASRPDDAPLLASYYVRNRAHLEPWEPPRTAEMFTDAYFRQRLHGQASAVESGVALYFLLRPLGEPTGPILGALNLTQIARGPFQAGIVGFSLDAQAVGKGFMFEALQTLIRFAFHDLDLHRLMANHLPENLRSARLLRRLGFVVEGYARDYLFINGAWRDHVLTALTNPSPRPPKASG